MKHVLTCLFIFVLANTLQAQTNASIRGYITDSNSGDVLLAATTGIIQLSKGVSTNSEGFFQITNIPPGAYLITASYVGYEDFSQQLTFNEGDDLELHIQLKPKAYQLGEVTVKSLKHEQTKHDIGVAHVDPSFINNLPSLFEDDIFRSLQLLPGVKSSSELSSGLYIRGGSPDQTLILFDHAPVYNPSHFFGFYSTFNPSVITDANLFKGNYPAKYGGRLGSVLSLQNRETNNEKVGGEVSVGMLAASAAVETPFWDRKGGIMVALRRSTIDPVLGILRDSYEDIPEKFYFWDLNSKVYLKPNANNHLSLSIYSGVDHLRFPFAKDAGIRTDYGNQTISGTWQHNFSGTFFGEVHFIGSRYFSQPSFDVASTLSEKENEIFDRTLKMDFEYLPGETHEISFGYSLQLQNLQLLEEYDQNPVFETDIQTHSHAFYIQDDWNVSRKVKFSPGLRIQHMYGTEHLLLEPRISFEYIPSSVLRLQAAYGRFSQYLTMATNDNLSGLDVWYSAGQNMQPAVGDQYGVGAKLQPSENYNVDVEFYYRTMSNLFEPDPYLPDRSGIPYQEIFRYGEGFAYGSELLFKGNLGKLTGFVGYSFSITRRRFYDENSQDWGEFFAPNFDRNHDFSIVASYKINSKWSASTVFRYTSGQPYTQPLGRTFSFESPFAGRGKHQVINGEFNAARMPAYHRLDIGFTRVGSFLGLGSSKFQFQVINVYSRRNIWFYNYDLNKTGPNQREAVKLLPVLPSLSYTVNF
ncbi:TonB-dependent receptor [Rhodohalobacter sp. 614A]|uniref:TonB-dependent receptor n=1 Tax=Rhodohalobacter sp. 614A TaxID=2908649 RepID=UPI001F482D5D|nr:TonB-dependent receptor [Rhodohalobacter sp. 614A]